jgi:hypothetical protein
VFSIFIIFYNKNKVFLFHFYIYIYLDAKFEVWRKKTHLILFQVGFFFNIYKFYFFLLFTLYLVSSFLEIFFFKNDFTVFPFPCFICFHSFFIIFAFLLFFWFMFVSCFYFFYSYFVYLHFFLFLCIYLFIYIFSIFFFKKIKVFLICSIMNFFIKKLYFCLIRCRSPGFPKDFFNRNGTSPGPPQRLPWPPCPALPCLSPQTGNGLHRERASQAFQTTMLFPMAGSAAET